MNRYQAAIAKAKELGAKRIQNGINWDWAEEFPNPEAGQAFVAWLEENGYDHGSYYAANPTSTNDNLHVDGVRFRL